MARRTVRFASLGKELELTQMGSFDGLEAVSRVAKILGPSFAPFVDLMVEAVTQAVKIGGGKDAFGAALELALAKGLDLGKVVEGLRGLNPHDLGALARMIEPTTKVITPTSMGTPILVPLDADDFFAGEIGAMLLWIGTALLFNIAGFTPSGPTPPPSPSRQAAGAPGQ